MLKTVSLTHVELTEWSLKLCKFLKKRKTLLFYVFRVVAHVYSNTDDDIRPINQLATSLVCKMPSAACVGSC